MKKISILSFLFCLALLSKAQYFNYLKANASLNGAGIYTDLGTAGTAITTNFNGGAMTFDDDNSSVQNIGFTFSFAGNNFTQFVLNTNGFIKLGNQATLISESYDVLDPASTTTTNVIYPFNMNLQATPNSEYRVFTTGASGSKVCTIQFKAVADSGCPTCSPASLVQYDVVEFQIKLYEASNIVEFIYGNFTASVNASGFIPADCGLKSLNETKSINVTKSSQTAFTGATFVEGPYTGNRFNTRNSLLPPPGFTVRFVPVVAYNNNSSIQSLYSLGKVPKNYDHSISAYISNMGNSSLYNFPVTLNITGANTFSNIQYIDTLKSNAKKLVTFPSFNSPNTGNNLVIVNLPNDDDNSNNADTVNQIVTNTTQSTAYDTTFSGTLGQSTNSIDFAVRVKSPTANSLTTVTTYFGTAGRIYNIRVFSMSADTPKTALYTSGNLTTLVGANIFTFPTPVNVTGDFFVIIKQPGTTATTSISCGYQTEDPIREKTFYFRSPSANSGSKWNDFAPLNSFRIMLDATMTNTFLPIKLVSFTGIKEGKINKLNWQIASEKNNIGFEIQRSVDGKTFSKIAFVNTKANNGNSSVTLAYNFTDGEPLNGKNYYRLRQLDKDGKEFISEVIIIKNSEIEKAEITSIYPNPTNDNISVMMTSIQNENFTVLVTDIYGKTINKQIFKAQQGSNKININSSTFSSGTYFVKVVNQNNENVATTKFVKL